MYSHTYSKSGGCWSVGTGDIAAGTFSPVSDHETEQEAAERVAWLNGSPNNQVIESLKQRIEELEERVEQLENQADNPYLIQQQEIERLRERMR